MKKSSIFAIIEKIPIIEAFDELDTERDYYQEKRKEAKLNKDYELADNIRKELLDKGIVLKDTREGTTFEVNN